jgi:hypothetical protein
MMAKIPTKCEWPGCAWPLGFPRKVIELRGKDEARGLLVSLCPKHTEQVESGSVSEDALKTLWAVGYKSRERRRAG